MPPALPTRPPTTAAATTTGVAGVVLRRAAPWSGLAVAAAYTLWRAWSWRRYLMDDAFIGFRYAANLLAGRGLVFNPGERVEGITNLGWTLLLAAAGEKDAIPVVAKVAGLLLALAALALLTLAARRLVDPADRLAMMVPLPLLLAATPDFLYFSLAGMETGLAAALVATAVYLAAAVGTRGPGGFGAPSRRRGAALGLVAGVLFTVRPEAALLLPAAAGMLLVRRRTRSALRAELTAAAVVFTALVAATTLFRLGYYGAALPNTFFAKRSDLDELLPHLFASLDGSHFNLPPPFAGLLFPLAGGYGLIEIWRRAPRAAAWIGAAAAAGAGFALYAPADWSETGRYFAPYLPAAWLALWWGLVAVARRLAGRAPHRRRAAPAAAAALAVLLAGAEIFRTDRILGADAVGTYPGYVLTGASLIPPARWIGTHLPAGKTLATRRIGAVGYFSGLAVFDYAFGLTDREVAPIVAAHGDLFADPRDPSLAAAWRRAAPDYILEDARLIAFWRNSGGEFTRDGFVVHGLRYRLARRFPIGDGKQTWDLCERVE